jgi:AcrR family transcriptional regulator
MPIEKAKRSGATRASLLRAAREEFADHGPAGARVDRIAEAAGCNKERIYGIFGSKDKLFDAVLVDTMREFSEVIDPLWHSGDVGAFIAGFYDFQRERPQLLRLLTWEGLNRGSEAADVDGWRREHYRLRLESAKARFGTDDPFLAGLITFAVCAIPNWVNLAPQLRALLLGDRAEDHDAIRAFLSTFAEGAARAVAEGLGQSLDRPGSADPVEAAAERLRRAQAEADAAKDALAAALRRANTGGASANALAKQVAGTVSRPVVLKMLAQ